MPALIKELIDKVDTVELVRDQLGAILLVESTNQQALAAAAGKDETLWALRVFTDRTNPWAEWIDEPDERISDIDRAPIVNISFDNWNADQALGNVVERQGVLGTFNIDVYGYGSSSDDGGTGHVPGDEKAERECLRGARLVRNIIMSAHYAYLRMQGVVGRRWLASLSVSQPNTAQHSVQHVRVARLALQVLFNEFSPQVSGPPLALLSLQVLRKTTGQLLLRTDYPQ